MKHEQDIIQRLDRIEKIILRQVAAPMTLKEAAKYLEISKSYLYKLTSQGRIPHSKPGGKKVYFDKEVLDAWALQNPVHTRDQLKKKAAEHRHSSDKGWRPIQPQW